MANFVTALASLEFIDLLPANFNREALSSFAWELASHQAGAIYVHLSGKFHVLLLKNPDTGVYSLWLDSLPRLEDLAREANAPRLGPVRRRLH